MSDLKKRNRHSTRLKDYDYSLEGAYFITLVTYHRKSIFGRIVNGGIELNSLGKIAFDQWKQLGNRFHQSDFSTFVIMPNHVHGIIYLISDIGDKAELIHVPTPPLNSKHNQNIHPRSLGTIVRSYKASVSFRINAMRGFSDFPVWQRNYYEKIIRNEKELVNYWKYIDANPEKWDDDKLHS